MSDKNNVEKQKEVQVINQETMATALKEALEKLARFEAQSAGQEVVAAPAVEAGASPAVAAAPAGERGGAGTAQ